MSTGETIRTGTVGKKKLRLVRKDGIFYGLIDGKVVAQGDDADDVWRRTHDEVGKSNPKYFGFDGARARFLRLSPGGFHSETYLAQERTYKVGAKTTLDAAAPLEEAVTASGLGAGVAAAFQETNLLHPRFELTRVREVLKGPTADDFIRAAARFTLGEGKPALAAMRRALEPKDAAKWPIVTYLPFLWRPEDHMFMRPQVMQDFAARVGHRFDRDYAASLEMPVYESLLDLTLTTEVELADLGPRDRIDVQSFIFMVGKYQDHEALQA